MSARKVFEFEIEDIGYMGFRNVYDKNIYSLPIKLVYKNPKKELNIKSFKTLDEMTDFIIDQGDKYNIDIEPVFFFHTINDLDAEYRVVDKKQKKAFNLEIERNDDGNLEFKTEEIINYTFPRIKVLDEKSLNKVNSNQNFDTEK